MLGHVLGVRCLERVCGLCWSNCMMGRQHLLAEGVVELATDFEVAHVAKSVDGFSISSWSNQQTLGHCEPVFEEKREKSAQQWCQPKMP